MSGDKRREGERKKEIERESRQREEDVKNDTTQTRKKREKVEDAASRKYRLSAMFL